MIAVRVGSDRSQWAALTRASGRPVRMLSRNLTALAGARDVLYVASGDSEGASILRARGEPLPWRRLLALGTDGVERWTITPEEHPDYIEALAPLAGCLFAIERRATTAFVTSMS